MDMNKTFFLPKEARKPQWIVIDAAGKDGKGEVVGRLATKIADILRGKDEVFFTPHTDSGDYVIVINAEKIVFTGDKMTDKKYVWYTGWMGGQKEATPREKMKRDVGFPLQHAVKGMLPKNKLSDAIIGKLKIYAGPHHPHTAQVNGFPEVSKKAA